VGAVVVIGLLVAFFCFCNSSVKRNDRMATIKNMLLVKKIRERGETTLETSEATYARFWV
jgi:hypothetical protein